MNEEIADILQQSGIRATSNRIMVLRTIMDSPFPLGLSEIERKLETLDKSSVFRVLTLLLQKHVVHCIEDGRGISKYEFHCSSNGLEDMHVHFYCEACNKVFCFEDNNIPSISVPSGFLVKGANFMLKGICPDCQ